VRINRELGAFPRCHRVITALLAWVGLPVDSVLEVYVASGPTGVSIEQVYVDHGPTPPGPAAWDAPLALAVVAVVRAVDGELDAIAGRAVAHGQAGTWKGRMMVRITQGVPDPDFRTRELS